MPPAPPPAYSIQRPIQSLANSRSLRVVIGTIALTGCVWSLVWAVQSFRYVTSSTETSGMKITDTISGVVYLLIAAIEAFGVFACVKHSRKIVKVYSAGSLAVILVAFIGGVVDIITDFAFKTALKAICVTNATTDGVSSGGWLGSSSSDTQLTEAEAVTYCNSRWTRAVWSDVIWLCAVVVIAGFAAMFAVAFARQLSQARAFQQANIVPHPGSSTDVPLSAYESRVPDYTPTDAPPYPGPPASNPSYDPDSKGAYVPHSAEDEAWDRSLRESERRERDQNGAEREETGHRAYVNEEEEEAWEQARINAGTAQAGAWGRRRSSEDEGHIV